MPKKRITWIGSFIILAAGVFCCWALFRYRANFASSSAQYNLVTGGAFLALAVAALAIFLWYHFNEKR